MLAEAVWWCEQKDCRLCSIVESTWDMPTNAAQDPKELGERHFEGEASQSWLDKGRHIARGERVVTSAAVAGETFSVNAHDTAVLLFEETLGNSGNALQSANCTPCERQACKGLCRYPDFSLLTSAGSFTEAVDVVVITHFHLDHSGALPYFTQVCGYRGPVIMTHPTKALLPLMLQDYHKVMVTRKGEKEMFTRQDIQDCISQVQGVDLHASVQVGDRIRLVAHYAGHVLGGAMFEAHLGSHHLVYTGDFNTTPDRHLSAARLPCLRPDLLISEATYATTIRDSKRAREREFLDQVHETVAAGGKVLIPVFAMGRAQDLQLMLHDFWKRMRMQVPMYSSAGMMLRANQYYRLLLRWTNPHVRAAYMKQPFPTMQRWEPELATAPGPCVLFATPGMLHGGVSLQVFKQWAGDARNLVVLPGYCIAGTLAAQLLASPSRTVKVDASTTITARCRLLVAAFSAHTDARGILGLLHQAKPRTAMLVHGEKAKMEFLQGRIQATMAIPCFCPANGSLVTIPHSGTIPIRVHADLLDQAFPRSQRMEGEEAGGVVEGVVLGRGCGPGQLKDLQLVGRKAAQQLLAAGPQFALAFQCRVPADVGAMASPATLLAAAAEQLRTQLPPPSPGVRVDTAASSVAVGRVTAVLQQGRSCTEAAGLPLESDVPPAASAAAARLAEWVKEGADAEEDGPGQGGGVLAAGRDDPDPGSVPAEAQDALLDDTAVADSSGNAAAGRPGPSITDREAETGLWTWLVQWAAEDEQLARSCMAALRSLKL